MDRNSSAHVAHVVGLQTDAVVVTETRLRSLKFALLKANTKVPMGNFGKNLEYLH